MHPAQAVAATMAGLGEQACRCDLESRIRTYGALADVFAGSREEVCAAVGRLRGAGSWCSLAFYDDESIHALAREAEIAVRNPDAVSEFLVERRRLIGAESFDPFENVVSPCGAMYVTDDPDTLLESLSSTYAQAGYVVRFRVPCESHVAVELDFMRFLLECVRAQDPKAAEAAARFFIEHLSGWSLLFAVAFGDAAATPIARYAAVTLDRFLSCEESVVRHSVPARCVQHRLADLP
ncbi:MAG: molecular chaperone TorD family protein [Anaerosomatales bacterium]|nr:molecular chaperone TorD family protein [Anaerosomatales bacterium]